MKYVQFHNILTDSLYDGFIVNEDASYFWTLDPICFEWLSNTAQLHLIDSFDLKRWEKDYYSYIDGKLSENWSAIKNHAWLFDFPLHANNVKYTHSIANYFDWFRYNLHLSVPERINQAKSSTFHTLPLEIHEELAHFILRHFQTNQ